MSAQGEEAGYDFQSYIADLSRVNNSNSTYVKLRRLTPKPTEFSHMPRPRSNHKIYISAEKASEEFVPANVIKKLTSSSPSELENFCLTWCTNVEDSAIRTFLETEGAIDIVNEATASINSETLMTAFCQFVRTLIEVNDTDMVDSGILMKLEDFLDKFPIETLFFFIQMPRVSVYARDAMVCQGVLGDVIALALKTDNPEVRISCSQVLHSAFACDERIAYEDVDLDDILKMLVLTEAEALYFVLLTLVEIVSVELSAVSDLYAHDVHTFLAKNISKEHLTGPCLCLAGNMATCEASEMAKLIESGVVREMIKQLQSADEEDLCFVLWGLANGVQSSPEMMIPVLEEAKFVEATMALYEKGSPAVRKDDVLFIATVFLFSPAEYIATHVTKDAADLLAGTLGCGKTNLVVRCLDAIARVLFLGYTNEKMKYTIDVALSSEILAKEVAALAESSTKPIVLNKSRILLAELDKLKEERKQQ